MCGIWASLGLSVGADRIDRVAHRGPDGRGWRSFESPSGPLSLGHRRLTIIDTSDAGSQPMSDASGRYWLVFNGEIYNYIEIRRELEQAGRTFRSQSDSEVLLQALAAWGAEALPKLLGMFAFAFWDDREKSLLLARDRFGIKPLYWAATSDGVAFASEIKQLHDLPGVSRRMDLALVRDFLQFGILDHGAGTMFAGVRQLTGGEYVIIDTRRWSSQEPLAVKRWYRLNEPGSIKLTLADAAARYRDLFEDSIRLHLRSDVRVGSCLSGGLDSSSIVSEASRQLGPGQPMTTVSAVFDEPRVNERRFMDAVIEHTRAEPHFVTFGADRVFEIADNAVWHQDEPFGSTSILAQWFVFAGARAAGVKVMLDGQGADEPLAGYHWLFGPSLAEQVRRGHLIKAARQLHGRRTSGVGLKQQLREMLPYFAPQDLRDAMRKQKRSEGPRDWLDGTLLTDLPAVPDPFAPRPGSGARALSHLMATLTSSTSVPMLLHWEDRNSMAHGIEARVPFLDHRLVELAIGLGVEHKIDGARTKVLLREAMKSVLPAAIYHRNDKLGFATPEREWLAGAMAEPMRRAVLETLDLYPGLLDREGTVALVDSVLSGARPADFTLWRIASVGIWGRVFGMTV